MTQHFKIWSKIALALCALSITSCAPGAPKPDISVLDMVIGGYKGAAGGPEACTEVHTIFTNLAPVHFALADCLHRMIGKVYMDGAKLNLAIENIDVMCTALGSCTYEQQQALSMVRQALHQARAASEFAKGHQ